MVLFYLSSQVQGQSNQLSTNVTEILAKQVSITNNDSNINIVRLNHIVRENAHYIVYFILGLLVMNASRNGIISLLISVFYGISDEIHQMFVPGRGAEVQDVLHDSVGAAMGILVFIVFLRVIQKFRKEKQIC